MLTPGNEASLSPIIFTCKGKKNEATSMGGGGNNEALEHLCISCKSKPALLYRCMLSECVISQLCSARQRW